MGIVLRTAYKDYHIQWSKQCDDLPWFVHITVGHTGYHVVSSERWIGSEEKTEGEALDHAIRLIEDWDTRNA